MPGSSKRLTAAQRKKIKMRYEKSGRRKDPATDIVLGVASALPFAGVAARGAAAGRAAASAAKASRAKKKYEKNEREAWERIDSQGDGPQPPTTRREHRKYYRAEAKDAKKTKKAVEKSATRRAKADAKGKHVKYKGYGGYKVKRMKSLGR